MDAGQKWQKDENGNWWYSRKAGTRQRGQEIECVTCGTLFLALASQVKRGRNYCSRLCANRHRLYLGDIDIVEKRESKNGQPRWAKDSTGQWWRLSRTGRNRAETKHCEVCEIEFPFYRTHEKQTGQYCSTNCSNKATKNGRERRGENHPNWKGGETIDAQGYVWVRIDLSDGSRGIRAKHRHVMEQYLGRPLHEKETVHHKDGNKENNALDNLELFTSRHPKGSRVFELIDFVVAEYPELVERAMAKAQR